MKKGSMRAIASLAIVLVMYLLIVFLVPFSKLNPTFWVSLVFTLIAIGVAAYSIYVAFMKSPDVKSKFYGFPLAKIGVIYVAVQIVLSFIFMGIGIFMPVWITLLVCVIALGLALLGLISAETVVDEIKVQDEKLKKDVTLMRSVQSKLGPLAGMCTDASTAEAVKKLAEDVRYSDPVSGEAVAEIEAELADDINAISNAVAAGDWDAVKTLCRKATVTLAERNRLCKLNK